MLAPRLMVIGSTNVDMICKLGHLPAVGETVAGGTFMQTFGGKGANQAVASARCGGEVNFMTCLGGDDYASLCLENFRSDGIDVSAIIRHHDVATGVALVMIDEDGRNYLAVASGANHAITPADIESQADLIAGSAMVIMQNEITTEATLRAIDIAAAAKVPILFNYAPVSNAAIPVTAKLTYLVVNENEAAQLSGHEVRNVDDARKAARLLKQMGPAVVVLTLGPEGSLVQMEEENFYVSSHLVEAVDTTAAGDTYCGALAVALLEGHDWKKCVQFATAASAISVTQMGAQPSIPSRTHIDAFLHEQSND